MFLLWYVKLDHVDDLLHAKRKHNIESMYFDNDTSCPDPLVLNEYGV